MSDKEAQRHFTYLRTQDDKREREQAAHNATMDGFDVYARGYEQGYGDGLDGYTGALESYSLGAAYPHPQYYATGYRSGWTNGNQIRGDK